MATVFEMGRCGLVKFLNVLNESAVSIFSREGADRPLRRPDKVLSDYMESHSMKQ
jgi:hypothetical protein